MGLIPGDGPRQPGEVSAQTFARKAGVSYPTVLRWAALAEEDRGPLAGCVRRTWAGWILVRVVEWEARCGSVQGKGAVRGVGEDPPDKPPAKVRRLR